jgi:hypothetical protein
MRGANPSRSVLVWLRIWSSALFKGGVVEKPGATMDASIQKRVHNEDLLVVSLLSALETFVTS